MASICESHSFAGIIKGYISMLEVSFTALNGALQILPEICCSSRSDVNFQDGIKNTQTNEISISSNFFTHA
jgi:hypothetical protein